MKRLFSLSLLFICLILVTACGKKEIVGSWQSELGGYIYTFNEDGTGSYTKGVVNMEFTYETDEDKLIILYKGNSQPFETTYKLDGQKIYIKDSFGKDNTYIRQ